MTEPTTQEAEKALEDAYGTIEDALTYRGDPDDMHDALAALRSLRTRIEELETKLAIAGPSMAFAEHKAAELWKQATKDREEIERLKIQLNTKVRYG